jgi:hypothetical protein
VSFATSVVIHLLVDMRWRWEDKGVPTRGLSGGTRSVRGRTSSSREDEVYQHYVEGIRGGVSTVEGTEGSLRCVPRWWVTWGVAVWIQTPCHWWRIWRSTSMSSGAAGRVHLQSTPDLLSTGWGGTWVGIENRVGEGMVAETKVTGMGIGFCDPIGRDLRRGGGVAAGYRSTGIWSRDRWVGPNIWSWSRLGTWVERGNLAKNKYTVYI